MPVRQYEEFLIDCLIESIGTDIKPGYRYQFKSPNEENSSKLHRAFLNHSNNQAIEINGISLPFVNCNNVQLIPVLHGDKENGFTENYISMLRDVVASRSGKFSNSALLIIHNSMLDTLINSALDVASNGGIWNPKILETKLAKLIDPLSNKRELSKCLLEDQLAIITEDGATIFGFSKLFHTLDDGELKFGELNLFDDPVILNMSGQAAQIRRRLNENRKLHRHISFCVEHYPEQLENNFKEFSPKFIKEHFCDIKDWAKLEFEIYLEEMKANKSQKMVLENIEAKGAELFRRAKSQTMAGQKEINLLIQVPVGQTELELELTFSGNDLDSDQLKVVHNKALVSEIKKSVRRVGGKRCWATILLPFRGEPTFFSLELKRDNRSEEYKFRCLLLEQGRFYLDEVKNCFRIEPLHEWMTLQLEEDQLRIQPTGDIINYLSEDDEEVDCNSYSLVNFENLSNQTEMTQFSLCSGGHRLPLNIEGPAADEAVSVPLLFDKERFSKLLCDEYNAEYNRAKCKIVIDNSENSVVGVRQQLLGFEAQIVDERLLYIDRDIEAYKLSDLKLSAPNLYQAYTMLFDYLDHYKTLPSLVGWGNNYRILVQAVIDAYEQQLGVIPRNGVLGHEEKRLLKIGLHKHDGKERLSPIHPLILTYHLQLVRHIDADKNNNNTSFAELPAVTLGRLVASGLLPFVYHAESEFAHVQPVTENSFWLDLVPQKQVSYSYVKRLVKDKLAEFTHAYSRLFSVGASSSLIINAINQGTAEELFLGLVEHFKQNKEQASSIHVNFYDDKLIYNKFDRFAEMATYDQLKEWLDLNNSALRGDTDMLIDLIRSRLTYSKFVTPLANDCLAYAHLAFFSNNTPVDCRPVNIDEALSGVLCDGLIAGEAAETKGNSYFTAFGLRGVDVDSFQSLRLARLLGNLWQPARQSNASYLSNGIGLAVSTDFRELLTRSYDSALWTTIIDPKVTLDFFTAQADVVLIHYSDQYTSSAGYDAITVTKQVDLFKTLLQKENSDCSDSLMSEFNAFNGEWLLKMLTANANERKEKNGIIGAYKFVNAMLCHSDIHWVPLSVAEMIRVSGNVGLKMSDSEFSRHVHGYRKGAISDDVLFVGFKGNNLYLLPLEVKTGSRPDFVYAGKQARELKRYLIEEILGPRTLASLLYRGLFIRQVLMQVEKFRLYRVITDDKLEALLSRREWWLKGEYQVLSVPNYVEGFVLAHVENDDCYEPYYHINDDNILQIQLPYALLPRLIAASPGKKLEDLVQICKIPSAYMLKPTGNIIEDGVIGEFEGDLQVIAEQVERTPVNNNKMINVDSQTKNDPSYKSEMVSDSLKVLFGHDTLRQTPLYWEPTNTARFMNTNTGIIGTMGTGKTQFTKSIITQLVRNQASNVNGEPIGILVFDYKSDYVDEEFLQTNQAKALKLFKLPYNPLSLYGNIPMLPVHTATGFAETMAKAFGLGHKQQLKLKKLILDAYEQAGINRSDANTWDRPAPTIAQLWELFLNQDKVEEDSLYAALDSLATYEIFETKPDRVCSLYDFISGVIVIELASYSPQIQNLVVALTLDLFYSQMQKQGKPQVRGDFRQITKMILVDEADNFMSQDFSSLRKILKEGREYGVGVILSTQDITHFKTGDNNYASYVLTWIVHRVSEIKNADIKAIFNKDDKVEQENLMEIIRKLDKHNSLYIDGEKRVKNMRDKAFWELINSDH